MFLPLRAAFFIPVIEGGKERERVVSQVVVNEETDTPILDYSATQVCKVTRLLVGPLCQLTS